MTQIICPKCGEKITYLPEYSSGYEKPIVIKFAETAERICVKCFRWQNNRCTEQTMDTHRIFPNCFMNKEMYKK